MKYTAYITQEDTGETVMVPFETDYPESLDYLWSEGNYACDCNRSLFFYKALGYDQENDECGQQKYRVKLYDENGKLMYEDDL